MLMIGDNLLLEYLEAKDKFNLEELINKKRFKVSDSPLTYRQTNALSNDQLIPDDRDKKEGWHKFSMKELIYLKIVADLKKFGMKHVQLQQLRQSFFQEPEVRNDTPKFIQIQITKAFADMAIGCALGGVEIIITIGSDGHVDYYDPRHYLLLDIKETPHITLKLSDYLNDLLLKIGRKPINIKVSISSVFLERKVTPKEEELMNIIRNEDYNIIKVKKNENDYIIYAEKKAENRSNVTEPEILKMLKDKDFQDISIIKRDGKIVSYKVEETIKL